MVEWSALKEVGGAPRPRVPAHRPLPDTLIPEGGGAGAPAGIPARPADFRPSAATELASFAALGDDGTEVVPDVMGAAGPDHLMVTLNTQVAVQSRSGASLSVVGLPAFWAAVGAAPFDPKLVFDERSRRFIFVAADSKRSAASALLLGVSAGDDPTGAWTLRAFDADGTDLLWADFPNVAVNKNWIAVTVNMFAVAGDAFSGAKMWVFDKAAALAPGALSPTVFAPGFDNVGPGRGSSLYGALTYGNEESLYLVDNAWSGSGGRRFARVSRITGTPGAPSWSLVPGGLFGGGFVEVPAFGAVVAAPQAGSAQTVDARDSRVGNAVFRDGGLWYAHAGGRPASAPDRNAVFWHQLAPASPRLVQSGVVEDPGGTHFFFPSIAVNGAGDVLLGFAGSSPSTFLSGYYAGRSGRDPPGAMQAPVRLVAGKAPYFKTDSAGRNRWGDYTATVADPAGDGSFWTIQQYAETPSGGQDRWGTWWGRVRLSHDLPAALASSRVFPVPWTPGSGDRFDSADQPGCGRGLVFEDIAGEATVDIYTVLGDLVRSLEVRAGDGGCKAWDGRNASGREVASGVYLAVLRNAAGEQAVRKLVVER